MESTRIYDPDSLQLPSGALIDGQLVACEGEAYEVRRPSDGQLARMERGASAAQVDQAVSVAQRAFKTSGWATAHPRQRVAVLRRWADLVEAHGEELARLESVVSPRIYGISLARDVRALSELIRYNAELADKINGEVLASAHDVWSLVVREPYGVVAGIAPWNAPLFLSALKLAPALAAGNAVVLKPAEGTPYSLVRLVQLAIEAGVPKGLVAVVPGLGAETGSALVRHPQVNYISFTGSTASGARIMADAAMHGLKPVSLELGGKSPQLVCADAPDLDRVADYVATSFTGNAGQICFCGTRLVVDERIADDLVERITRRVRSAQPGPTWSGATTLAPIFSEAQARRIEDIVARAKSQGAQVLEGGARADTPYGGAYFQPTLIQSDSPANPIVQEEVFGPVLAVQRFRDFDEGLALADHPVYGLAAAVHTSDLNRALKAARAIQAGTVWVNHYGPTADFNGPNSPYKQSGMGQDGGVGALTKYLKTKNARILVQ